MTSESARMREVTGGSEAGATSLSNDDARRDGGDNRQISRVPIDALSSAGHAAAARQDSATHRGTTGRY